MRYRMYRLLLRVRKLLVLTGILSTIGILTYSWNAPVCDDHSDVDCSGLQPSNVSWPNVINILYWTSVFGRHHQPTELTLSHPNGTVTCRITGNHRHFKNSHLVVFHFHQESWTSLESIGGVQLPATHQSWQKWIYYSQEPQTFHQEGRSDIALLFENSINAMATHMRSSDIPLPYGEYRPGGSRWSDSTVGKSKLAAILVSNCGQDDKHGVDNGRFLFVQRLQKLVPVDVYGQCGIRIPECASRCKRGGQHQCLSKLGQTYKFYLSLENSDCDDYITEKYWKNALRYNMVPVVRGNRNHYDVIAIPGSYVHVDQFPSIRALADYLLLLDRNDTLYNSYFDWKRHYSLLDSQLTSDCSQDLSQFDSRLCQWAVDHWAEAPKHYTLSEYIDRTRLCTQQ